MIGAQLEDFKAPRAKFFGGAIAIAMVVLKTKTPSQWWVSHTYVKLDLRFIWL